MLMVVFVKRPDQQNPYVTGKNLVVNGSFLALARPG